MKSINLSSRKRSRAFSLVEVTIAMAIASIALVTLMGLIPQGMDTMREAGDTAIEARIHQQVLNELQLTPFENENGSSPLDTYFDGLEIYYDSQGEELSHEKNQGSVEAARKQGSFSHIYSARITIPRNGDPLPVSMGGKRFDGYSFGGTGSGSNENIRTIIVEISSSAATDPNFDWDDYNNRKLITSYQSAVVRMGRDLN